MSHVQAAALTRLEVRLAQRTRWRYGHLLGTTGYRLPNLTALTSSDSAQLVLRGPAMASATVLAATPLAVAPRLTVTLHESATDCLIVLGPGNPVGGEITVVGPRATVILGGGLAHPSPIAVTLWRDDELFFMGAGTSANGLRVVLHGGERCVLIGEDCMFASDTVLRGSDMHGVIDMQTGEQPECHGDILIEPHVWIGQDAIVLKNVCVGFGAMIGAKALVNRSVPRFTMAAGNPARVLREAVSWNRADQPDPGLLSRLRDRAAALVDPTAEGTAIDDWPSQRTPIGDVL